jgi:hypothetical protein
MAASSRAVFFVFAILPAPRSVTPCNLAKGDERFKCANCYRMRVPALIRCHRQNLVRNIVPCLAPPPTLCIGRRFLLEVILGHSLAYSVLMLRRYRWATFGQSPTGTGPARNQVVVCATKPAGTTGKSGRWPIMDISGWTTLSCAAVNEHILLRYLRLSQRARTWPC